MIWFLRAIHRTAVPGASLDRLPEVHRIFRREPPGLLGVAGIIIDNNG